MKKSGLKFSALATLLLLMASTAGAQEYMRSRSLREAFKAPPTAEIQVINKYGDIHLVPWGKDSVVFEIELTVTSSKQAKVDKIYDYIDFDFKSTGYYVIAQTVFSGQNTFWSEMADVANTIFSGSTSTRINYTVYFPENNDVKIENKFGNIYTTEHKGKVDIALSNGDLKAFAFNGTSRLKLDFGNASIDRINNGKLLLNYAEINIDDAGELNMESKSSRVTLASGNKLLVDSKRDKYYIKKIGDITGTTYFSYINLDLSEGKINLTTTYGELQLLRVSETFRQIDLNSQFTDITLYMGDRHFYEIEVLRDDRAQITMASGVSPKGEAVEDKAAKTTKEKFTAGRSGQSKVPVYITIRSGKLFLAGT